MAEGQSGTLAEGRPADPFLASWVAEEFFQLDRDQGGVPSRLCMDAALGARGIDHPEARLIVRGWWYGMHAAYERAKKEQTDAAAGH